MSELEMQLRNDLLKIGLRENFTLVLKPYSRSFYGRYDPNTNIVTLYVYKVPYKVMYSYKELLLTAIHEVIHCKQWHDPSYSRVKGVMHNVEFKRLYNQYSDKAKSMLLMREVKTFCIPS